jgi:signal peptidase II
MMLAKKVNPYWWRWLLISSVFILLDQVSKHLVVSHYSLYESIHILPFLNFTFVYNHGAAFSFLSNAGGWQVPVLFLIAFSITLALVYWLCITPRKLIWQSFALSMIIGGALGNIIDRVRIGKVVDFIDFHINAWHFAIFNVADMAVSIGVFLLIVLTVFCKEYRT